MFNIGDTVKIKENAHHIYSQLVFMPEMLRYLNQICTIKEHYPNNNKWFKMDEFGYWWDEKWLEPATDIDIEEVTENEIDSLFESKG